ncbi:MULTISPECIES: hypothetical protein [unclassified Lentimonas]|uniref:hypothetical protein n=1 Tax=unclassified Lentimonas TaxID=2630993 RepID=UPI0013254B0D|nr:MULTISPECIES: hypothetical protein [unclassified Lentimonas]CAA6693598.1 Unannotated [Lentimonas sp. CC10]CAA6696860.1 Unannotated [Lentimonas sp. CC19]CAA7071177.1 Unannotated [Lentimonas sp. CC11]
MYPVAHTHSPQRFKKHLPLAAALVLNPWFSGIVLVLLGGLLSFFSVHYALSLLILILPFFSYYLERSLLERILIPPFSCIVAWAAIASGIGVALIIYGRGGTSDPYLMRVQLVTLMVVPFSWIFYRLGFGQIPRMTFPDVRGRFDDDVVRPLAWVGWVFLLYQVTRTIVLAKTGALDRGDYGHVATDTGLFGIWTYFNLFPRFDSFAFFLVPVVWQRSYLIGRVLMLALLGVYFLIALVSGSRGIVFFPMIFIGVGFYFFRVLRLVKLDITAIFLALLFLPLIVFIDAYRNTDAYRATRTTDIIGRLQAFDDALVKLGESGSNRGEVEGQKYLTLGGALFGKMDHLVYEITPSGIPYAGVEGFEAIPYTFVPTFIKRDKPILLDSNPILWRYTGRVDRTGKAISLEADAYRRFGWIGVPVCVAFFFWVYGLFCGKCFKIYLHTNALWGILLILYTFSYFQARPFGTVLESWWSFSYNLVKHLVVLYIGYRMLIKITGVRGRAGAIEYGGRQ